ncbi:MAG: DnaJ domain-containing protein [Mycoplasmataceae bacterium]|nr:DnaJ domain-containing protein [Mycoplasmataceae bacterium]
MNYYQLLQINQDATSADIEHAFKNLTKISFNKDVEEMGKVSDYYLSIKEAYLFLLDPVKRKKYDKELEDAWKYDEAETTNVPIKSKSLIKSFFKLIMFFIAVTYYSIFKPNDKNKKGHKDV